MEIPGIFSEQAPRSDFSILGAGFGFCFLIRDVHLEKNIVWVSEHRLLPVSFLIESYCERNR